MGFQRQVDIRTYGDTKFLALSPPKPCGRYLWLYLLTGPHTTPLPGISVIGEAALAEAIGWPLTGFRRAFAEIEKQGMVKSDWRARVVVLPNAIEYNWPENPNIIRGWARYWDSVPECQLKNDAALSISKSLQVKPNLAATFAETISAWFTSGFAKQELEEDKDKGKDSANHPPGDIRSKSKLRSKLESLVTGGSP